MTLRFVQLSLIHYSIDDCIEMDRVIRVNRDRGITTLCGRESWQGRRGDRCTTRCVYPLSIRDSIVRSRAACRSICALFGICSLPNRRCDAGRKCVRTDVLRDGCLGGGRTPALSAKTTGRRTGSTSTTCGSLFSSYSSGDVPSAQFSTTRRISPSANEPSFNSRATSSVIRLKKLGMRGLEPPRQLRHWNLNL
jgi:hypothetical protein